VPPEYQDNLETQMLRLLSFLYVSIGVVLFVLVALIGFGIWLIWRWW
jgi:hypothetical protein